MKLKEIFASAGLGVMGTSTKNGVVNLAIYSRPHIINEETLVWGMSDGRTYENVRENPNAAYLYKDPEGFTGLRLDLKLDHIENEGQMLEAIRTHAAEVDTSHEAIKVNHAVFFKVVKRRPLV